MAKLSADFSKSRKVLYHEQENANFNHDVSHFNPSFLTNTDFAPLVKILPFSKHIISNSLFTSTSAFLFLEMS